MCHKAGFLAVFDYAAASPYVDINMNGVSNLSQIHQHFQKLSLDDCHKIASEKSGKCLSKIYNNKEENSA